MEKNPLLELAGDGIPLVELKKGLMLYLARPPSREAVRRIYSLYIQKFGHRIGRYRSTSPGNFAEKWDASTQRNFELDILPNLYKRTDWGWILSGEHTIDSWLFMFHGYRPHSEPGKASFFRFDFDWMASHEMIHEFASQLMQYTDFMWGSGGYYLQCRTDPRYSMESCDLAYEMAQRYWGAEARNLDVTVHCATKGLKCVNWLTIVGNELACRFPDVMDRARQVACESTDSTFGVMFKSQPSPVLGDRDQLDSMEGYIRLAEVLEPLQTDEHGLLGGRRWTDETTMQYLKRFTAILPSAHRTNDG